MQPSSELIYLHTVMARLCKLFMRIRGRPDEEDTIRDLKSKIMYLHSEITNIVKRQFPNPR